MNIWSIYNNGSLEMIWQQIEKENYVDKEATVVMGDLNIRIGEEGKCMEYDDPGEIKTRKSKDKTVGKEGKSLIEKIENKGWTILNGSTTGDEEGEFTFVGSRGHSVIDYAITNEAAWKIIGDFKVVERVESDHLPICIRLQTEEKSGEMKEETEERNLKKVIEVWNEETIAVFREDTEVLEIEEKESDTVEERWKDTKEIIQKHVPKKEIKIKKWKLGIRSWWDKVFKDKKKSEEYICILFKQF